MLHLLYAVSHSWSAFDRSVLLSSDVAYKSPCSSDPSDGCGWQRAKSEISANYVEVGYVHTRLQGDAQIDPGRFCCVGEPHGCFKSSDFSLDFHFKSCL